MGFFDWLTGSGQKRGGQGSRSAAAKNVARTEKIVRATPASGPRQEVKSKRVFESDKESSQARDIVKDWLKDDN